MKPVSFLPPGRLKLVGQPTSMLEVVFAARWQDKILLEAVHPVPAGLQAWIEKLKTTNGEIWLVLPSQSTCTGLYAVHLSLSTYKYKPPQGDIQVRPCQTTEPLPDRPGTWSVVLQLTPVVSSCPKPRLLLQHFTTLARPWSKLLACLGTPTAQPLLAEIQNTARNTQQLTVGQHTWSDFPLDSLSVAAVSWPCPQLPTVHRHSLRSVARVAERQLRVYQRAYLKKWPALAEWDHQQAHLDPDDFETHSLQWAVTLSLSGEPVVDTSARPVLGTRLGAEARCGSQAAAQRLCTLLLKRACGSAPWQPLQVNHQGLLLSHPTACYNLFWQVPSLQLGLYCRWQCSLEEAQEDFPESYRVTRVGNDVFLVTEDKAARTVDQLVKLEQSAFEGTTCRVHWIQSNCVYDHLFPY